MLAELSFDKGVKVLVCGIGRYEMNSKDNNKKHKAMIQHDLLDEKVFGEVVEAMSDGVMLVDHDGSVVLHNSAFSKILEVSSSDLTSKGLAELFLTNHNNRDFNDLLVEVIQKNLAYYHKQVKYYTQTGQKKTLLVTSSLFGEERSSHSSQSLLLVIQDITDFILLMERNIELYKERIDSLDHLARSVAHTIRNPLMAIGGMVTRILRKNQNEPWVNNYLRRVLKDCQRLEKIVQEVRIFADISVSDAETIPITALSNEVCAEQEPIFSRNGLRLVKQVNLRKPGPVTVSGDYGLIKKTLVLLLDNAREESPDNGVVLFRLTSDSSNVRIEVKDMGAGVDPESINYIFDPFYSSKASGIGMGLTIAKRIAHDHNGNIEVYNHPDGGAIFSLIIPMKV